MGPTRASQITYIATQVRRACATNRSKQTFYMTGSGQGGSTQNTKNNFIIIELEDVNIKGTEDVENGSTIE